MNAAPHIHSPARHLKVLLCGGLALCTAPMLHPQDTADGEQVVVLSPFEVTASDQDIGYYASNTLAGSRLNTRVSDLASAITVVTAQQMQDTGATDFNDVFLYEAGTEGASNYTPIEVNRGGLKDNIGGSATNGGIAATADTANRVRGLSSPTFAWNYYPSLSRIPADVYNVRSIEINRGPNSLLFGLGTPAGIVNQSVGYALLDRDLTELVLRYGTNGYRTSIAINQTMHDDRLAVYVAGVHEERDYSRDPSHDKTDRVTLALTAAPWRGGTFKLLYERWHNDQQLPNYLLPRDGITPWINAGRPVWNPLTQEVTLLDSGQVFGPFGTTTSVTGPDGTRFTGDNVLTNPDSPSYIPGIAFQDYGRPALYVQPDGSIDWRQRQATLNFPDFGGLTQAQWLDADPARRAFYDRRMTSSAIIPQPDDFATGWISPSLNNQDIYDWEEINLNSVNFGEFEADTYNIEYEQRILPNLFLSTGFFQQEFESFEFYPVSQQQTLTAYVDTNQYNLDGTPNPNYLKPYIEDYQQDLVQAPEENKVARAMLAYQFDFTGDDNWMRWLGRHRLMGLYQWQDRWEYYNRYRISMVEPSDAAYVPETKPTNFAYAYNTSSNRRYFFVGEEARITAAPYEHLGVPGYGGFSGGDILTYDWRTASFYDADITLDTVHFEAGNGARAQNFVTSSWAGALQSYLLDDRVVLTLGLRNDDWKARSNSWADLTRAELYPPENDYRLIDAQTLYDRLGDWQEYSKTTYTTGLVVHVLNWLSFHYNKSDNWNPPREVAYSLFGNEFESPQGEGEDYGFSIDLAGNKLVARVNFFTTSSENERLDPNQVFLTRTVRVDADQFEGWAEAVVRVRNGQDPTSPSFYDTADPGYVPLTDAQIAQVEEITGFDYNWPEFAVTSTRSLESEGFEIELIYNPIPNWNMKFTFGKADASYQSIAPEYEDWIAERMPVWTTATASDLDYIITRQNGETVYLGSFWNGYGFGPTDTGIPAHPTVEPGNQDPESFYNVNVLSAVSEIRAGEGGATPNLRKWRANFVTNYRFAEGFLNGFAVGGAVRLEDRAIIGYHGLVNDDGQYYLSDVNRPIYDTDVGADRWDDLTHFDFWASYTFKLFDDRVTARVQVNVRDAFSDEGLIPVNVLWDGTVSNYRIKEPRQIFVTTRFEF